MFVANVAEHVVDGHVGIPTLGMSGYRLLSSAFSVFVAVLTVDRTVGTVSLALAFALLLLVLPVALLSLCIFRVLADSSTNKIIEDKSSAVKL